MGLVTGVVRRAVERARYGPLEEAPEAYGSNPLFYRQLVEEMDDVTGYVAPADQSLVARYLRQDRVPLHESVAGETAFTWAEDVVSELSGAKYPFKDVRFTVSYRDQGDRRHVRLHGVQEHSFFRHTEYVIDLEGVRAGTESLT